MKVLLNGAEREIPEGSSVSALLRELALEGHPVAVELNREIVPRPRHAETRLREGDRLEIVTLVGGG